MALNKLVNLSKAFKFCSVISPVKSFALVVFWARLLEATILAATGEKASKVPPTALVTPFKA